GPLDAPVPLESTSRQEHRLDPWLRLSRAVQPLLPSVAPLFYSHAHTTAHCGGWRWRGSWSHPAPPCPVSAHPSHGPVSGRGSKTRQWHSHRSARSEASPGDTRPNRNLGRPCSLLSDRDFPPPPPRTLPSVL